MDFRRHPNNIHSFDIVEQSLKGHMYERVSSLSAEVWVTPEPVPFSLRQSGRYAKVNAGDVWGALWDCGWFHFTGRVPKECAGKPVVLLLDVGGEGLVVDSDGKPVRGLTTPGTTREYSHGSMGKRVVWVSEHSTGAEAIDVWVDAGCNDLSGKLPSKGALLGAEIAVCRENVRKLYYDYSLLRDLLKVVPVSRGRYSKILNALTDAGRALLTYDEKRIEKALALLRPEVEKRGGDPSFTIYAVGHAHIDLAWLWPLRESRRKGARTFSTAVALLRKYTEYVFGASQAQLYEWIRQDHPSLFEEIKGLVAAGRWEIQGGFWVESDVNIPAGESLVRQALYGQEYFKKHFGIQPETCWIPDSFGYTAQLPQIAQKSGMKYIQVHKLGWSELFKYPHHSFVWRGLDGSSLFAHSNTVETYNSWCTPQEIARCEVDYADKLYNDSALLMFGLGDGGGGPGMEHLELLRRQKNLDGVSPVAQAPSTTFYKKLEEAASELAVLEGPLDLDKHTGTFTSHARIKAYNHAIERSFYRVELLHTLAALHRQLPYPAEKLEEVWKKALLYQFHDIICGTSIERVYTECYAWYEAALAELAAMESAAMMSLGPDQAIWNTLDRPAAKWFRINETWKNIRLEPFSCRLVSDCSESEEACCSSSGDNVLENDCVRIGFDDQGHITSIYDKAMKLEFIDEPINEFLLYDDRLNLHDEDGVDNAWDFPPDYRERMLGSFELKDSQWIVDGPYSICKQLWSYATSVIQLEICLATGSRIIDFKFSIDWAERQCMLRTDIRTAINNPRMLRGTQYGYVEEYMNGKSEIDAAKLDSCVHRWADLSDGAAGLALLNKHKYGIGFHEGCLDFCLLRSPTYPDANADKGLHQFSYALFPHLGSAIEADVEAAARLYECPPFPGTGAAFGSLITIDGKGVILDWVKRGERGGVVLRFYETFGRPTTARVEMHAFRLATAQLTDLLERPVKSLDIQNNSFELDFGAFEILTVLLEAE